MLTAFQLSWELEHLALRENEFKDSYMELSNQCKKYACDLLDQCRSSEEVIAVLNKVGVVVCVMNQNLRLVPSFIDSMVQPMKEN